MPENSHTPESRRRLILLAAAVLIGALILLFAVEWGSIVNRSPTPASDDPAADGSR